MSLLDLASDIYMSLVFFQSNRKLFAWANVVMIAANVVFQFVIQLALHSDRPLYLARELLFVVSFAKPVVDAVRVASYSDDDDMRKIDLMSEFAITRLLEMLSKTIPSGVVQAIAFVLVKEKTSAAFCSIIISTLSTAYTASCMSYGKWK